MIPSDSAPLWSPAEEARLKHSLEKAFASGAKSLSEMLGIPVTPATWGLLRASVKEPPLDFFQPDQGTYGVFMPVQGDLTGTCLLCFSAPNAKAVLEHLLTQLGPSVTPTMDMVQSALEEAGNIFINEFIKTLGREMKIEVYPSSPKLEQGAWQKVWEKLALSQLSFRHDLRLLFGDFTWMHSQPLAQFFTCLSMDSWHRLHHWASQGKSLVTSVGLGAMEVVTAPTVLKATDLGSCVALILYDRSKKTGGLAHVMLPRAPSAAAAISRPGKYADHAVDALLKRIKSGRTAPKAWIVGGADMLTPFIASLGSIGHQNAEALRKQIKHAGLKLEGEDIGGSQARTVELLTGTGELWIKSGQKQRRERIGP